MSHSIPQISRSTEQAVASNPHSRRQFFGTLGKALGAGGLLLPWAGKGPLALPADLGKAATLPGYGACECDPLPAPGNGAPSRLIFAPNPDQMLRRTRWPTPTRVGIADRRLNGCLHETVERW
jgi:hypothetical protein